MNETIDIPILKEMPVQDARKLLGWIREILKGRATLATLRGISNQELDAIYRCAYDQWHAGNREAATRDFGFLAMHKPDEPKYMFALGYAFHQQGDHKQALNFYTRAMFLQQNDPRTIYRIAQCLQAIDEINAARDALDAAISLCYDQNENGQYDLLLKHAKNLLSEINN